MKDFCREFHRSRSRKPTTPRRATRLQAGGLTARNPRPPSLPTLSVSFSIVRATFHPYQDVGAPNGRQLRLHLRRRSVSLGKGGRHPWLDALVVTPSALIGIESKRFEPYRFAKSPGSFSDAFWEREERSWGGRMTRLSRSSRPATRYTGFLLPPGRCAACQARPGAPNKGRNREEI